MLILLSGLIAGFLHVISGPDHLAAVSPLAIENKKASWLIGLKWGLGHTGGVFIVGMIALLFRQIIPIDLISSYSERFVGVVLIGIGLWGLQKALRKKIHTHEHEHDGVKHFHFHTHTKKIMHEDSKSHFHTHTAMVVGIIHGLAGSSHFLGVLPALALPTNTQAVIYMLSYGIGTISAMIAFSHALGYLAEKFLEKNLLYYKSMSVAFSSVAIVVGIFWLFY